MDEWIEGSILKLRFPRIIAVAKNKVGKVKEYGHWHNNQWVWAFDLRRRFFDWECAQWHEFHNLLLEHAVNREQKDALLWKGTPSGLYTPKAFCKSVLARMYQENNLWKQLWAGLAPPKVEIFCWLLIRGKVVVRDLLVKRGMLSGNYAVCRLCNKETETVGHHFFSCEIS
ncbi:hypothetical protein REPUB_Repub20aG0016100 [Reevesia pubescens]